MDDTLAQLEDAEARFADLDKSLGELLADPVASDHQLNNLMEKFANRSKSIGDLSNIEAKLKYDELMEAKIKSVEEYIMDCMKLEMESKWDGRLLLDNYGLHKLPDVFSHIAPFILELSIRNNKFTAIPQPVLSLPNIKVLDISENPLVEIPPGLTLPKSLVEVRMNHIFPIQAGTESPRLGKEVVEPREFSFAPFSHVQSLSIQSNGIISLSDDISSMESLQVLDASDNPLAGLPPSLKKLTAIKVLRFSGCGLETPAIESLEPLTELDQLYLDRNKITSLPYALWESFYGRQKVGDIHIEGNSKGVDEIVQETIKSKPIDPNPIATGLPVQIHEIQPENVSETKDTPQEGEKPPADAEEGTGLTKYDSVTSFFSKGTTGDATSTEKFERRLDPEEISELFYVSIEHCLNCEEHQMTTRHVPESYAKAFSGIANELNLSFPNLDVRRVDPNIRKKVPRLGSFEITLVSKNGHIKYALYSKLEKKKFPNPSNIARKLESYFRMNE